MSEYEKASVALAAVALLLSFAALWRSQAAIRLTQAQVEIELRNQIRATQDRVDDFLVEHGDWLASSRGRDLSEAEQGRKARLVAVGEKRTEAYLSALDEACQKYLDKKIDTERFKKSYQREIRQAVQDEAYAENFKTGHAFNALIRVYGDWENPEKG